MENASIIFFGPLKIAIFGISIALAFIASSFYFWRVLKDDYPQDEEELLRFVIWVTLSSFLSSRIVYLIFNFNDFGFEIGKWVLFNFYPGFSIFGALVGAIVMTYLWVDKKRWDLYLILDTLTISGLIAFIIASLGVLLTELSLPNLAKLVFGILLLLINLFLQKKYRRFIWYKSGKLGFLFSSTLALAGLGLFAVEFLLSSDIYWESFSNLILFIGGLVILYQRSQRNLQEDLGFIKKLSLPKINIKKKR